MEACPFEDHRTAPWMETKWILDSSSLQEMPLELMSTYEYFEIKTCMEDSGHNLD